MSALAEMKREDIHAWLMAARRGDPVEDTLARILSSWCLGQGVMPQWLGLGAEGFRAMLGVHFPTVTPEALAGPHPLIDPGRSDELADLRKLLRDNLSRSDLTGQWMVEVLIAGCMGSDHLWQDLGLWCRGDLSRLMLENFETLARRNVKDMKWKKFLYKQLCEAEGIYTCRAPSCEVCVDYQDCFGSEE